MKVACVSDLHGLYKGTKIPECDLLVLAGDCLPASFSDMYRFEAWLESAPVSKVLAVPGNHRVVVYKGEMGTAYRPEDELLRESRIFRNKDGEVLVDKALSVDGKIFYGFPWVPWFDRVNPLVADAFMLDDFSSGMNEASRKIPTAHIDMFISHGPPSGLSLERAADGRKCGNMTLSAGLCYADISHHVMGHIHENHGKTVRSFNGWLGTVRMCYNVSRVDEKYRAVDEPVRVITL